MSILGANLKSHSNERKHSELTTKSNRNQTNDDKQQHGKDYNLEAINDSNSKDQHTLSDGNKIGADDQQQRSKSPRDETQDAANNDTKDQNSNDRTSEGNAQLTKVRHQLR